MSRIVAKGIYTHRQMSRLVSVKQYLIEEEDGARFLLLRFANESGETVTSFRAAIVGYTEEGKRAGSREYAYEGPPVLAGAEFGPAEKIPVHKLCTDVRVELLSVRSRDYVYEVKKNSVRVRYLPEENGDDRPHLRRAGKNGIFSGTKKTAAVLLFVALILTAAIGALSALKNLGERETRSEEPAASKIAPFALSFEETAPC